MYLFSPHVREFGFWKRGNFCIGIRNTAEGLRNPTNDWNPSSTDKESWIQYLESDPEFLAWNPESKTLLAT